jgi:hypothetical protein
VAAYLIFWSTDRVAAIGIAPCNMLVIDDEMD